MAPGGKMISRADRQAAESPVDVRDLILRPRVGLRARRALEAAKRPPATEGNPDPVMAEFAATMREGADELAELGYHLRRLKAAMDERRRRATRGSA